VGAIEVVGPQLFEKSIGVPIVAVLVRRSPSTLSVYELVIISPR
jgi:hypothetical protein